MGECRDGLSQGIWRYEALVTCVIEPEAVETRERGVWVEGPGRGLSVSGGYRYSLVGMDSLRVEHMRGETPVWLGDVRFDGEVVGRMVTPHLCGQDLYNVEIRRVGDDVAVEWTVRGPRKETEISLRYRASGGSQG